MILAKAIGPCPWSKIHDIVKPVGLALGFIGLGVWGGGIYDGSAKLPWLHQQAAVLHKVEAVDIPKLKAADHCQRARADKATNIAKQAIVGAVVDSVRIPDAHELPVDDCPHPAGK